MAELASILPAMRSRLAIPLHFPPDVTTGRRRVVQITARSVAMEFAVRQSQPVSQAAHVQTCPQCRERSLVMQRRHVSPPRLGTALVTEYYDCDCCDARYQYSPASGRWKPVYQ